MTKSSDIQVLHIDDEPGLVELAADMLEREDSRFSVETATSASDGLDRLTADDFDCIVSDYQMPGQNGIEFLETVREEYPDLPFILYTGRGSEEVASDALSAGASDYLQKDSGNEQYELLANRIESAVAQFRAEQQAATTQRRLRELSETTDDVHWMVTADWSEFHFVNSAYEDVFGRSRDVLEKNPMDFLHGVYPADRDLVTQKMQQASNGEPANFEFRVNADEDFQRRVWVNAEPIHDETGDPVRIVGFIRDITERTHQEKRFQAFIENSTDIITVLNSDGTYQYQSPSSKRVLGYEPDELIGETAFDYIHPEDRERVIGTFSEAVNDPELTPTIQYRFKHKDGSYIWLETAGTNRFDNPAIDGLGVLNSRDITDQRERKQVLEQLTQRSNKLIDARDQTEIARVAVNVASNVFDASLTGVHLISEDCERFEAVATNDCVREEFGVPPVYSREDDNVTSELVCQTFDSGTALHLENTEEYGTLTEETLAKSAIIQPLGDHGVFIMSATETEAFDETDLNLIELVAQTVTAALDRVERETDLRENKQCLKQERDRFEQFMNVVSHDLRNPLTVAEGHVELAQETGESKHLATVADALDRSQALIDDLLMLAREDKDVTETEPVKLADVAESSWQTVETTQSTLETGQSQVIEADRSRLKQLFENLYRNAVEHGGDDVTVWVDATEGGFCVADTGPGVPESDREEIFEAGYSTNEDGTGFGLQIVEQVADAHDWELQVTDGADGGARFEFTNVEALAE